MSEPFLAEIKIVSFNFPPKGWAKCDGQILPINQNQALFSLLGTNYGGNGQTTFALPDMRGRVPVHPGSGIILAQKGGAEAHTLIVSEMAAHTHIPNGNSGSVNAAMPSGNTWGAHAAGPYSSSTPDVTMHNTTTNPIGGSQPHNNMQPYLVLNFIIALQGIFPSQN
jgi:microcystin-dependent protein